MTQSGSDHVAAEVRAEVARQRIGQQELADQLGLSQSQLSVRLTGKVAFRVHELIAIAEILGVPAARFLPDQAPERVS